MLTRQPSQVQGPRMQKSRSTGFTEGSHNDDSRLQRSHSVTSAESHASISSVSSVDSYLSVSSESSLKRRPHIRRRQRRQIRPLPIPPLPPVQQTAPPPRIRRLPVRPLPVSPFPHVSPTRCTTPAPQLSLPTRPFSSLVDKIDWDVIFDEIMRSGRE